MLCRLIACISRLREIDLRTAFMAKIEIGTMPWSAPNADDRGEFLTRAE